MAQLDSSRSPNPMSIQTQAGGSMLFSVRR